jgi:hypothetical protein
MGFTDSDVELLVAIPLSPGGSVHTTFVSLQSQQQSASSSLRVNATYDISDVQLYILIKPIFCILGQNCSHSISQIYQHAHLSVWMKFATSVTYSFRD